MARTRSAQITAAIVWQAAALGILLLLLVTRYRDGALVFAPPPAILLPIVIAVATICLVAHGFRRERKRLPSRNPNVLRVASSKSARIDASPDLTSRLRALDWYQFEKIVALAYRKLGYHVTRRGGAHADGGIDLILEREGKRTAVQCKHWQKWKVGVKTVRELLGAMAAEQIPKGILVTMRGYTDDATRFANDHGIELVDEAGLISLLNAAHLQADPECLRLLNDQRKFCPKCESIMVQRTSRKGSHAGRRFWGCSQFPKCRFTFPVE